MTNSNMPAFNFLHKERLTSQIDSECKMDIFPRLHNQNHHSPSKEGFSLLDKQPEVVYQNAFRTTCQDTIG